MSEFIQSDNTSELWSLILKDHWDYLETEDGKEKIEKRLKLEECLEMFLCIVQHDRKFFLPETAYVLRQTIEEMEDFTVTKGIIGFETISQYADNLYTKPWRKEFRVLKMYSGSFQHEMKSNLLYSEKLFKAMGYRRLNEETLILDGPICPDQVTNVSRDAMAAYVECRIIKKIQMGLAALDLKCNLRDIYEYRENYIGGISNAIKKLSYDIQDRRHRKEKLLSENSYSTIQHISNAAAPPPIPPAPTMVNQYQNTYYHNMQSNCALHQTNGKLNAHYQPPHMSHSRSLEQYGEPPPLVPHRHSFDHQQQGCTAHHSSHYQTPRPYASYGQHLYEAPYDCIDGGVDDSLESSSASYAAVAPSNTAQTVSNYTHPYNVSGNRVPLPYNISNQLNTHYSSPAAVTCNGIKGSDHYRPDSFESIYATVSKPSPSSSPNWNQLLQQKKMQTNSNKDCRSYRQQRAFPPEQLIDFDDRALLTSHDYHAHQHSQLNKHFHEFYGDHIDDRIDREYKQHNKSQRFLNHANGVIPMYAEPKDILCQQHASTNDIDVDVYSNSLYARPMPRRLKDTSNSGPQNKHLTDKYIRKIDNVQGYDDNNRKMPMELNFRGGKIYTEPKRKLSSSHTNEYDDCESTTLDDFVTVGHSEHPQRSPTQATKNQDGVGSFESWDYVFQNLERSGYSKDHGERGDLLVQSLDLDSLNLTGTGNQAQSVEKRHSGNLISESKMTNTTTTTTPVAAAAAASPASVTAATATTRQLSVEKSKKLEKLTSTEKRETKTMKKEKPSILKQTNTTTINGINRNSKTLLKQSISNNLNVDHSKSNGNANKERNIIRQSSNSTTNSNTSNLNGSNNKMRTMTARSKQTSNSSTQIIISPNEWSCQFCTFLNPDTKHICEMCHHTKGFNLDETVSNTPTCV